MRMLFYTVVLAALMSACSKPAKESEESLVSDPRYSYSNSFVLADASNAEIVRKWNNAISARNLDEAFNYAADSMSLVFADGSQYNATKDSIRKMADSMLSELSDIKIGFIGAVSVTSTDKKGTWVVSYTDEQMTSGDQTERHIAHELYNIVDGKIRTIYAFANTPTKADTPTFNNEGYSYSGSFEVLGQEKIKIITDWYDNLLQGNYNVADQYIADSVDLFMDTGDLMQITRDSLLGLYKSMLTGVTVKIDYGGGLALRSLDKGDEWVLLWYDETVTGAEGSEKTAYHEVYRIVNNKMRSARLFKQAVK